MFKRLPLILTVIPGAHLTLAYHSQAPGILISESPIPAGTLVQYSTQVEAGRNRINNFVQAEALSALALTI